MYVWPPRFSTPTPISNPTQEASHKVFYARDPLGRRSLLSHEPSEDNPYFLLASVSADANEGYDLDELSTEHIGIIDLDKLATSNNVGFIKSLCVVPLMVVRSYDRSLSLDHAPPNCHEQLMGWCFRLYVLAFF